MLLYDAVMQCVSERVSRNALAIPASAGIANRPLVYSAAIT